MVEGRGRRAEDAVAACVEFLLSRQSSEGSWSDWDLSPGRATSWTTAYIGCQLSSLPRQLRGPTLAPRRRAARWLLEHEFDEGGWGYSERVGCDADSTAHAILFLWREEASIPARSYGRLLAFQQPDGGFSTYAPEDRLGSGSWGISHPDVTPVAGEACLTRGGLSTAAVERARGYVERRCNNGLWDSFWWSSPLYGTRASLAFLTAARATANLAATRSALRRTPTANPFERGLLLDSFLLAASGAGGAVDGLGKVLVHEQLADGSWTSVPVLRVTDRNCETPWAQRRAGALYADTDRLFTSATVLAALCRYVAAGRPRLGLCQGTPTTRGGLTEVNGQL